MQVAEEVPADIRLHQHAEGVAPVADHVLQPGPQQVCRQQKGHHHKKGPVLALRNQLIEAHPGDVRKGQVDEGDEQRAGHVQAEEVQVGPEIAEENAQKALVLEISFLHVVPPYQFSCCPSL